MGRFRRWWWQRGPSAAPPPRRISNRTARLVAVTSLGALLLGATAALPAGAATSAAAPAASGPGPAPAGPAGSPAGKPSASPTAANSAAGSSTAATRAAAPSGHQVHYGANGETDVNSCPDVVAPGQVTCFVRVRTDVGGGPGSPASGAAGPNGGPSGYGPSFLQSAYNAPSANGGLGQTVAVVDSYDDPNAAADLAVYRAQYGLPACTTANGCFRKVDQNGGSSLPPPAIDWSHEISLDVDMVSALCPNCHILLVEADTNQTSDLGIAVNTAVSLGANVVSNSYGGPEYNGEAADASSYFTHPGVAIVVSTGDSGYGDGPHFPAASGSVTAVGGTSLVQRTNTGTRNGSETAWSGGGAGCSAYMPKPTWQHDAGCPNRTIADVSAEADPATGVATYDSYYSSGYAVAGGTSASAPIVGAIYALAANRPSADTLSSYPYARPGALNDVTSGSNGSCGGSYLCTAGAGYDGPTGLGTPSGTAAFSSGPPSFEVLGCCLAAGSGPAAASWAGGRLDVAIRGTDNAVWHKFYSGGWSGFESLGGATSDNPAIVSWGPGRLDVFVRGTDNQLWHRWYANGWSGWEPLGGGLSSAPTVTTWGPGRLDVFARGTDNQLWHRWFANGWSAWQPLGGGLASAPSAAAWSPGRIDVVVKGLNSAVWHLWYAGGWSGWESLGGSVASAPGLEALGAGRLDLYAQGLSDNGLNHASYNQGWSGWIDEGGGISGPPSAVSWGGGRTDLFVNGLTGQTGQSGHLMHAWWG